MRDGGAPPGEEAQSDHEAEVLEENWLSVQVFQRCKPDWIGAMKPVYAGIAATEMESVCRLLGIPTESWPEVSEGVRVMTDAVAKEFKERSR